MARSVGSKALAQKIGARMRTLRQEVNLTQEQLALASNLSPGMVALIESGKRLPSLGTMIAVAGSLHVELIDLLAFDVAKNELHRLVDAIRRKDADGAQSALAVLRCLAR